jgi:PAS domain S-box-containing protein
MRKILAIDDQKENLLAIEGLLDFILIDAIFLSATSGFEGVEIAKNELPDIILLDIIMPDIDGFEVCELLKNNERTKYIPIIMLSSLGQEPVNRVKGLNIGADAFLARPFNPTELKALINVMLRIKKAEETLRFDKKNLESIINERTKKLLESNKKLIDSEQRYRHIIENSQEWIWEVDNNGVFTFSSSIVENILGYKVEEIVGKMCFFDLFIDEDRENLKNKAFEIVKRKEPFRDFINCNTSKNGNRIWLSTSGMPLFNNLGEIIGYRGFDRDITDSKLETQIQKAQIRLFEFAINHSVEDFLQSFLEEVETLTNSDLGFCHFVENDQETISLQAWSSKSTNNNFQNQIIHKPYLILKSPEWANFIKNQKSVINNDNAYLCERINLPKGVSSLISEIIVPVIRGEKVVAILGVGNRRINYHQKDLNVIQRLTDVAWEIGVRKRTEEILRRSEELNRSITKTAVDAIVSIDSEGIIMSWNIAAEKIFDYSASEMIGEELSSIVPAQYQEQHKKGIIKIQKGGKTSIVGELVEITALKKDGTEFPVELSLSSWEVDAERYFTGIIRDITERKRSEKIQSVLYQISTAVITSENLENLIITIREQLKRIIDASNYYIALYEEQNDTFSLPFMADEKDEIGSFPAGKTLTAYVINTQKSILVTFSEQEKMQEEGLIDISGSRSKVWLGVPLKVEDKVIGVIAVQSYNNENAYDEADMKMLEFVSDQISLSIHRKKALEELVVALERATESDKLKTAFLQNISHEIRTPMNGILGFASLLSSPDISDEEQKAYIDIISISGSRMLNTLSDLMDISMLETGQVKLSFSKININKELQKLHNDFMPDAEEKGLQLNFISPSNNFHVELNTDQEKLYAIISNLIKNSIKYTNKGIVDFGFEIKNDHFLFFVKDTGIGIPKNRQEAIFNRFVQADIEEIKVFEGSGLGLSIAKAYVEMLKGEIWVNSQKGLGANFYFTVPILP